MKRPGQIWEDPTGLVVRLRRPSRVPGCWVWSVLKLTRGEHGKCPTIGAGRIGPFWKLVQEAPIAPEGPRP